MNDNKPGFQIGDKVVIIGPSVSGEIDEIGKVFEINFRGWEIFTGYDIMRKYPLESLETYRVDTDLRIGDWVEVIGPAEGSSMEELGHKFQIRYIQHNGYLAGFPAMNQKDFRTFYYHPRSLRKLEIDELEIDEGSGILTPVQTLDMIEERLNWLQEQIDREKKILRDVEDSQLNYRKRLSDVEHIVSVMLKTMQAYGKIQCEDILEYFDPKTIECAEWVRHRLKDIK